MDHFRVPPGSFYQNEVQCSTFEMKMIFYSRANKNHFHKKGCALGLILKLRVFGTQNWPGRSTTQTTVVTRHQYVIFVLLRHHFTGIYHWWHHEMSAIFILKNSIFCIIFSFKES